KSIHLSLQGIRFFAGNLNMSPLIRLLASFVALMMAMGIGRFALTPKMPHLLSEGQIDLTGAGLLAAA
ncbi:MFS transporter, partial [Vibrio cholerae]|uniref:YbfB/YjiJ family MFS transporter n=1 Tax=Vibrio cholerae TaxID=666 RepID=UPI001C0FF94F